MVAATAPKSSILEVPVPLVPGRVASLIVRHGTSGYPDVVAWRSERRPVFVELKGPGDGGAGQAGWLKRAFDLGSIAVEDFLLLRWTAS